MRHLCLSAVSLQTLFTFSRPAIAVPEDSLEWTFNFDHSPGTSAPITLEGCTGLLGEAPAEFEEALCSDLNYLQSQYDIMKLTYAENLFERCWRRLKSGFNGSKFRFTQFEADSRAVEQGLAIVNHTIQRVRFPGTFAQKVAFATEMLQVLRDCARFMDCYVHIQDVGHELIYFMFEGYAEAMSMHDEWGNLDTSIPGYAAKICHLSTRLTQWEAGMDALPDASLVIYIMFRDQRNHAKRVIEKLRKQIVPPATCA